MGRDSDIWKLIENVVYLERGKLEISVFFRCNRRYN